MPILTTKLYIPPRRANAVARPRLLEQLDQGADGKLSLVTAPAGFGKTTLVTEWLALHPDQPVAWVSLDEQDSEPVRFLTYSLAAIQTRYPDYGQELTGTLNAPQPPNLDILTHDLLNTLAQHGQRLILVWDDFHTITDDVTHQIVNTLIDYAPPHLHFVITSRDTPPLILPRWRARGQLTEIQASDLRFTTQETQQFLTQTMGLTLDESFVNALEMRTEGWAAGLQLAAISLRGTKNADIFVDSFTGRDRRVADYLLTEVLSRQTEGTRDFLLQTSVLERFNASLCAEVLGSSDSVQVQQFLEGLETTDLFIVPLDNERYWYRYHHLFADLLRQRLQGKLSSDEIAQLHLRASQWYEAHRLYDEAIQQAIHAGNYGRAAQLIPQIPFRELWEQHTGSLMLQWAKVLPDSIVLEFPKAGIWFMYALTLRGEIHAFQHYLALLKDSPSVEAEWTIFESIVTRNEGNMEQALHMLQETSTRLTQGDLPLKVMVSTQLAYCQTELGLLDEAETTLTSLLQWLPSGDPGLIQMRLEAIDLQGSLAKIRGNYFLANESFQESLRLVDQLATPTPQVGLTYFQLGSLYYQWNELETAEKYFQKAADWGERSGILDLMLNVPLGRIELAFTRGEDAKVRQALEKFLSLIQKADLPAMKIISDAIEAITETRLGNLEAGVRWANASGLSFDDQPGMERLFLYLIYIQIRQVEARKLRETSGLPGMVQFLDRVIQQMENSGHTQNIIRTCIFRALALDLLGETKAGMPSLHRGLEVAEPGSILRLFLDQGAPLKELLEKALSYGKHLVFIRRLLVAFAADAAAQGDSTPSSAPPTALPEMLTDREYEILQLLAAGLSNKTIGDRLVISNNTVRTHIKNLYGKLGVDNRTQAIMRAREVGLL